MDIWLSDTSLSLFGASALINWLIVGQKIMKDAMLPLTKEKVENFLKKRGREREKGGVPRQGRAMGFQT